MKKVIKGQKVRRINENYRHLVRGAVYEVLETSTSTVKLVAHGSGYSLSNFEPVGHVHHDLIIKWAKGAVIQYKDNNRWFSVDTPVWDTTLEYRVKPENEDKIKHIREQMETLAAELKELEDE